jgi:DNA invertase Pin-like site-specific DNA recombinase
MGICWSKHATLPPNKWEKVPVLTYGDAPVRTLTVLEQLQLAKDGRPAMAVSTAAGALSAPRVGEYARISDDQEDEATGEEVGIGTRGAGVRRQLRAINQMRQARGWERHDEDYTDNDLSAFKETVIRPGFERLIADLEAGLIDGIVCYDLDRLVRRPDDLERLIRIYDRARAESRPLVFASVQGQIDLGSEDGIAMARVLVAFANKASRDTARRLRLKHAENRDFLRLVGGTRPFGWQWVHGDDGRRAADVLDDAETDLIRTTAADIVAAGGASWGKIAEAWNAAGFRSPRGKVWIKQTVKQVMTSPRLAGWMVHKGQVATHSQTGMALRGQFPPILNDETYEQLLRAVAPDARGVTLSQDEVKRYLLAGLVVCGTCGAKMDGNGRSDRSAERRHYYVCKRTSRRTPAGDEACGRVSISGVGLDELITDLVLPRLVDASREASYRAELPHTDRLLEITRLRDDLLRRHRAGELSAEAVFPDVSGLEHEAADLRAQQERWLRAQGSARKSAGLDRKMWAEKLTMAERRQLVGSLLEMVVISPATRRTGSVFDQSRVVPVWRQ